MKGKAIIFSAPSGAGKTTIVRHLIDSIPHLEFSISATTRAPRSHEKDGEDYYFLSKEDFEKRENNGEVLEWEEVYKDVYYGTLKSEVDRIWEGGSHVIFDVDVKGGINLKQKLGENALSVFVKVKDLDVLRKRLKSRNTESTETYNQRVDKAVVEMKEEGRFDQVILNDDLDAALEKAEKIVKDFLY